MGVRARLAVAIVGILGAACGGGARSGSPGPGGSASAPAGAAGAGAPAKAGGDRNACHLLSHAEVSAVVERRVTMADQTEADETSSTCDWEDESGTFAFGLTVHWSGGKEQWHTWRLAQGLGDAALRKAEGKGGSDDLRQGLVPGVGDAAYFSPVLPALVLKGDTLLEIKFALAPKAETKFKDLAATLLARLP